MLYSVNLGCTIVLVLNTLFTYKTHLNYQKHAGELAHIETLWSTAQYKWMLFEMLVLLISPQPFFLISSESYAEIKSDYQYANIENFIQKILLSLIFLRLYLIYWLLLTEIFMNQWARRVCEMNNCKLTYVFAVRCLIWEHQYKFVFFNMVILTLIFSYIIWNFEHSNSLGYFLNSVWMTFISEMIVGFGEYYPKSILGRLMTIIAIYFGISLIGIFVINYFGIFTP